MSGRYKPLRRLRNEIASLAFVAVVPIALVSVFPFDALRPLPDPPPNTDSALCAFVTLSPAEEREALAAARAAWQLDRNAARRIRTDLFADALPARPPREVGEFETRHRTNRTTPEPYTPDVTPSTLAAPSPAKIAPQDNAVKAPQAFSREELLRL